MNKEALLKLADHLENGQLGHKNFDFSVLNCNVEIVKESTSIEKPPIRQVQNVINFEDTTNGCGTNGCAIGECPIVFKEWKFSLLCGYGIIPVLVNLTHSGWHPSFASAAEFFDLEMREIEILFVPNRDLNEEFDEDDENYYILIGKEKFHAAYHNSSRKQIADHIREFVELKEKSMNEHLRK